MAESNNVYVSSFSLKLGKSGTQTLSMLREASGEHFLNRTAVFQWHTHSKASRMSVEDYERLGLASTNKTTEIVDKIQNSVHKDRRQTISELSDMAGIIYGIFQEILTENLNMSLIAAKFVPRPLRNDQKQRSVSVCLVLREKATEDPTFIYRITMGDESWSYGNGPQTEQQSS
jgi:hypothetical protein